jgi:hypothetical protein
MRSKMPGDFSVNAPRDFFAGIGTRNNIFEVMVVQEVLSDDGKLDTLDGTPAHAEIQFAIGGNRGRCPAVVKRKRIDPAQSGVELHAVWEIHGRAQGKLVLRIGRFVESVIEIELA